jgi:hypothetical protein
MTFLIALTLDYLKGLNFRGDSFKTSTDNLNKKNGSIDEIEKIIP